MRSLVPARRWFLACSAVAVLAGCASVAPSQRPDLAAGGPWSGRLALQVKDTPGQSFSALFDLKGTAQAGELALSNPLGGTIALLSWGPGTATLRGNGQTRQFDSVEALVRHATGTAIPVAALFDWLRGVPTPVPGWHPDLSQLPQGRIFASRTEPPPQADLRVAIDR